jgi:hypothetical protein
MNLTFTGIARMVEAAAGDLPLFNITIYIHTSGRATVTLSGGGTGRPELSIMDVEGLLKALGVETLTVRRHVFEDRVEYFAVFGATADGIDFTATCGHRAVTA